MFRQMMPLGLLLLGLASLHAGVQGGEKDKKETQPKEEVKELVIDDELTNADLKDKVLTESLHKPYCYKMTKGKSYQIDLVSKNFDAYLRLENPKGEQVAADDDSGGMLNARIIHRAAETGEFNICAMSLRGGATGKFRLIVKELPPPKGANLKLDKGQVVAAGNLAVHDPPYKGKRHKLFLLPLEEGKTYQIDMQSKAFDSYLYLENPDGDLIAEDDDGGGFPSARIVFKAAKAGTYRIICTYFSAANGEFTLSVKTIDKK